MIVTSSLATVDTDSFLQTMEEIFGDQEVAMIRQALELATRAHEGQMRKYEGIPYITHPMAVATDVATKYQDIQLTLAALLHDVVEDTDVSFDSVYTDYGQAVGYLVEAVSKEPLHYIHTPEVMYSDKIEKLLAGGMQDVRVLLLKIADRDHNLKSLEGLKPNKQIRMTFETQAIYEPLKAMMQCASIAKCEENFKSVLGDNDLNTAKKLKKYLFTRTYNEFDNDTFELAYSNTQSIVRRIEDKEMFESLIEIEGFDDKISLLNIEESLSGEFSALLKFTSGYLIQDKNHKFTIATNEFTL